MTEYDIEPFMPGISPIGKGTPAMKELSVARPYIPEGTGYNMLRPKPGYSNLRKNLQGLGRYSHSYRVNHPNGFINPHTAVTTKRNPRSLMAVQGNIKSLKRAPEMVMDDFHSTMNSNRAPRGFYSWGYDAMLYPEEGGSRTKRHEIAHALQNRRKNPKGFNKGFIERIKDPMEHVKMAFDGMEPANKLNFQNRPPDFIAETDARIVETKSIREGLKKYARDIDATYKDGTKAYDQKGKSLTKALGRASELIPNKPGNFTGRVPTFRGMGAGLVDMFTEGPALQEAKSNPLAGMGKDERARIEAAYEYGL